jgi:hypothetical protein
MTSLAALHNAERAHTRAVVAREAYAELMAAIVDGRADDAYRLAVELCRASC